MQLRQGGNMYRTAWCQAFGRGYGESWQEQSVLLCDRSWKDMEALGRGLCVQSARASTSVYCYVLLSACSAHGSAGCVGSITELQLFLDTKQLVS